MIARIAHFVFGVREQRKPFHFVHYLAIESCRRVLEPDVIYLHYKHLPWGPWWERVSPHLQLREVDLRPDVRAPASSLEAAPTPSRSAHSTDFCRLDALFAHGGLYADIDTVFVN